MYNYKIFDSSLLEAVKSIYKDSNWQAYLNNDKKLKAALDNSLYLYGAFDGDKLIGFIRCVGDGEHIVVVQDLIVLNDYMRQKIASKLLIHVMDKYEDVRAFQIITDKDDKRSNAFYRSLNFKVLADYNLISYIR